MTVSEALRASPFFADLSPWDLETLRTMMIVKRYSPGAMLMREGQPGHALFLLLEGRVALTERDPRTGGARRLQTAEPGETLGFLSLIDPRPQEISATAVNDVVAAALTRTAFDVLRRAGAHIAFDLQSCIFRHLQRELLVARGALVRGVFGVAGSERVLLPHVVA